VLLSLLSLATACAESTVSEPPRIDPIDAGLSATPARPRVWAAEAETIPQSVVEWRWSKDRQAANACVDQFVAYRTEVELRDAALRGGPQAAAE